MEENRPKWHLGFDCATKTFAFSLSYIDINGFMNSKKNIYESLQAIDEIVNRIKIIAFNGDIETAMKLVKQVTIAINIIELQTRNFIRIIDGETVDLFPDRNDDDIYPVERVRAIVNYVETRIKPIIDKKVPISEKLRVVIEFQMGPNFKSRIVATSLITLYAKYDVIIVGPSLKNKIYASEDGKYCYFAERYRSSYYANKAHAIFNFAQIEKNFGTSIPITKPASLRGHIADSFMQIIGYLVHGVDEESINMHF